MIGFGTWFIDDADAAERVRTAIEIGYRHIDTAQAYGNERGVGQGIRDSGIDRSELFISTKTEADIKDYAGAAAGIDGSLEKLGLDYVDLFLVHAPQPWADFREGDYTEGNRAVWRAMEHAVDAGKIKQIGVSNFRIDDLAQLDGARIAPQANQILAHPGNTDLELIHHCQERGMLVQAYSPFGHGEILKRPELTEVAERNGVTPAQVCLQYLQQLDTVPLPKASSRERMQENFNHDFTLNEEDMAALLAMADADYGEFTAFPVFGGK